MRRVPATVAVPKYLQIANDLVQAILHGDLAPGQRAPSENEIIRQYGVSNTTARKALRDVEQAGWVTRVKGKGTFVRRNQVERAADKILSFTRNMILAGRAPATKVLDRRVLRDGFAAAINGRNYAIRGPVFKIHRLRLADGVPMMIETRYISTAFCPGLDGKDLTGSLYDIYEQDYGLRLTSIDQMLSVEMLGAGVREFFDLQEPVPALRVDGVTFCGKEMILEIEASVYRGDLYRFAVRAT